MFTRFLHAATMAAVAYFANILAPLAADQIELGPLDFPIVIQRQKVGIVVRSKSDVSISNGSLTIKSNIHFDVSDIRNKLQKIVYEAIPKAERTLRRTGLDFVFEFSDFELDIYRYNPTFKFKTSIDVFRIDDTFSAKALANALDINRNPRWINKGIGVTIPLNVEVLKQSIISIRTGEISLQTLGDTNWWANFADKVPGINTRQSLQNLAKEHIKFEKDFILPEFLKKYQPKIVKLKFSQLYDKIFAIANVELTITQNHMNDFLRNVMINYDKQLPSN